MLLWSTDIHLDCVHPQHPAYQEWIQNQVNHPSEGILLTGDLANATNLETWLLCLAQDLKKPIYFVLGNHDFYKGSIQEVLTRIQNLHHPLLFWLDQKAPIQLNDTTTLIGSHGWGDGGVGDFLTTPIRINDHRLIEELAFLSREETFKRIQKLGQDAALLVAQHLQEVQTSHIIVATHVPPFRQSTWYQDRYGDWDWMPDFCCAAMGQVLMEYAQNHPQKTLNVYCGHSHGQGAYSPLKNLSIFTGKAEYGKPSIQGEINSLGRVVDAHLYPQA